jgi:type II restriction/modification system DNA methylase subunit YeeA
MTPQDFINKWRDSTLKESAGSQTHFNDLCRMLGEKNPTEADPAGDWYAFEKGATKTGGGDGWADVWKRGCFAWEYKGKGRDLAQALKQLKLYQGALDNPPLLIVCDMEKIEVHTAWTNMVQTVQVFALDDLIDARVRDKLKQAFSETGVEVWKPGRRRADLTAEVARDFVELAQNLRARGHAADKVAHFVNRMVFCMFAEDVALLPEKLFTKLLKLSLDSPSRFVPNAQRLFAAMAKPHGQLDFESIEWFNGGLFDDDSALPLERDDIKTALRAAGQDWSNIDPSIMGTLFERGLDPDKRSQLGAHYTDPEKIMMIVNPVIIEPLLREWAGVKAEIEAELDKRSTAKSAGAKTQAFNRAKSLKVGFLERLKRFRILDPACGSGNFLYLGLKALKDIEHRINTDCEALGLARDFPAIGPENMLGIEINPFAAELARVSLWIGEIQWMREHGFDASRNPVLKSLDNIACHDALLNADGTEYQWPAADAIIGNPPFLGGKRLRDNLGDVTVDQMFAAFEGRVPAEADLVCYWFAKAREKLECRDAIRVGLVSTNSIRGGSNREVLDDIADTARLFDVWSDEPWVLDGAAVRVSLVCFDVGDDVNGLHLDGRHVQQINTDLTATVADLTTAKRLKENAGVAFMGDTKGGAFDVSGELARQWLAQPQNPNGRLNSEVLRPWVNGMDVTRRSSGKWIIDFGWTMSERDASLYEAPFQHLTTYVKPVRALNKREAYARNWWRHVEARQGMWAALTELKRYIVTPRVSKYRVFAWCSAKVCPDSATIATARDDDATFGILHSRFHELWSLGLCTWLGVGNDPRYTPSTTFETFPFPSGLTPNIPAADYAVDPRAIAIATAAKRLNELRENWLNPADLVRRVPEVVAGYPDRILPIDDKAAAILKKRTLTNLYNERPAWLDHAHRDLDAAVAAAYGWADWGAGLPDEVILERLFKLNQERAGK